MPTIPSPKRLPFRQLRRLLESVGIKTSPILDIQYPTSRIVSFPLHEDFVLEFTTVLYQKGRGGSPLVEFDSCDPANLKDPKFTSLPNGLRAQKAREIENCRCLRSRVVVARSFLRYERINQAQFDAILAEELEACKTATSSSPPVSPSSTLSAEGKKSKSRLSACFILVFYFPTTLKLLLGWLTHQKQQLLRL